MQKKLKNKQSIIANSLSRNHHSKQKRAPKDNSRCKSQNAHRVQESLHKKPICRTHRQQHPTNMYHTLQSDKNQKMEQCYKRIIEDLNICDNKITFHQFTTIVTRMKRHFNKRMNFTEEALVKMWKIISKNESKISEKQLSFSIFNISNILTSSEELQKPRQKAATKSKIVKIKKQSSNFQLSKHQPKTKKSSKSFLSQKQNIDTSNRFQSLKPRKLVQPPELQVIVKIQQGISERLMIYPDTCLTTLARQFGAKYRLPNCKIVMLKDMIQSQLKRHLTQITEESADHYMSDRSGLLSTLQYDDV